MQTHDTVDDGALVTEGMTFDFDENVSAIEQGVTDLPVVVSRPIGDAVDFRKGSMEIGRKPLGLAIVIAGADIARHAMVDEPFIIELCQAKIARWREHRPAPCVDKRATDDPLRAPEHRLDKRTCEFLCAVKGAVLAGWRVEPVLRRISRCRSKPDRPLSKSMDASEAFPRGDSVIEQAR